MNKVNSVSESPHVQPFQHARPSNRAHARGLGLLGLLVLFVILQADSCGGGPTAVLPPGLLPTPTPCVVACEPPALPAHGLKTISADHFSLYYYSPPMSVDSSSNNTMVLLGEQTPYGIDTVQVISYTVPSDTTAANFLAAWLQQHIDPSKFTTLQQTGGISGAEIGYVAGAGVGLFGITDLPNAPNTPLYFQVVAAVNSSGQNATAQNAIGIVFVGITALDPTHPDPSSPQQDRGDLFDAVLNTVVWL